MAVRRGRGGAGLHRDRAGDAEVGGGRQKVARVNGRNGVVDTRERWEGSSRRRGGVEVVVSCGGRSVGDEPSVDILQGVACRGWARRRRKRPALTTVKMTRSESKMMAA